MNSYEKKEAEKVILTWKDGSESVFTKDNALFFQLHFLNGLNIREISRIPVPVEDFDKSIFIAGKHGEC